MAFTAFISMAQPPRFSFPGLEKGAREMEVIPLATCGLLLLIMAVVVIRLIARGVRLRQARRMDAEFDGQFRGSAHALALFQDGIMVEGSPRSTLYQNACRELAFHLLGTDAVDKNFVMRLRAAGRITPLQWQAVQRASQRSVTDAARWLGSGLTGSGVRSLPWLGVLGALLNVLEHGGTGTLDLTALCASLWPVALSVLLFMVGMGWHRSVVRRAGVLKSQVEDFAVELGVIFERGYVDHRHPIEALPSLGSMGLADGPTFSLPPAEPTIRMTTSTAHT